MQKKIICDYQTVPLNQIFFSIVKRYQAVFAAQRYA